MELGVSVDGSSKVHNCFVSLPVKLAQDLIDHPLYPLIPITIHRKSSSSLHVSFTGSSSSSHTLSIPLSFARLQKPPLTSSEHVTLTIFRTLPPPATEVTLTPMTSSDYDIIALHASYFESNILNQINIVYPSLRFPLSLPSHSSVTLSVTSTIPNPTPTQPFTLLTRGTKLTILPPPSIAIKPSTLSKTTSPPKEITERIVRVLPHPPDLRKPHVVLLHPNTFINPPSHLTLHTSAFTTILPTHLATSIPINHIALNLHTRLLLNAPILSYITTLTTPLQEVLQPVTPITVVPAGAEEEEKEEEKEEEQEQEGGVGLERGEVVQCLSDIVGEDGVECGDGVVFRIGNENDKGIRFVRIWFDIEKEKKWRKWWNWRRRKGWIGKWDREEGFDEGDKGNKGIVMEKKGFLDSGGIIDEGKRWMLSKNTIEKVGIRWEKCENCDGVDGFDGGWGLGNGIEMVRGATAFKIYVKLLRIVDRGMGVRLAGLVGGKGMGKSMMMETVAKTLREDGKMYRTVWLKGRSHAGEKTRRMVKRIKEMFAAATVYAPAAVCIDDADEVLGSRWGASSRAESLAGGSLDNDGKEDEDFSGLDSDETEDDSGSDPPSEKEGSLLNGDVDANALGKLDEDVRKDIDENDMISSSSRMWIAETFTSCVQKLQTMRPEPDVVILISCSHFSHLHPLVRSTIDRKSRVMLPAPTDRDRAAIFAGFVKPTTPYIKKCLSEAAESTVYFSPRDLQRLVHCSTVVSQSKPMSTKTTNSDIVFEDDNGTIGQQIANFFPEPVVLSNKMGTEGIQLRVDVDLLVSNARKLIPESRFGLALNENDGFDGSKVKFTDIGGLEEAKKAIIETLNLSSETNDDISPKVMKGILNNAPISLSRHLFIYGPPGCGKTLLTKAISSTSEMKTITVLGPSLLSKYVGGSEQAVRNLFLQADSLKPCTIVIDEIDGICPSRGGHGANSSGVVERVVNMFLAILDGAGKRLSKDIHVVGVTNRPNVVDKALLRPGRLGRHVWVGFPSRRERKSILECLVKGMKVDVDASEKVVELTDGWTGADLRGLVVEAELRKVREGGEKLMLVETLGNVGPSVTKRDRIKWERIRRSWTGDEKESKIGERVGLGSLLENDEKCDDELRERVALR